MIVSKTKYVFYFFISLLMLSSCRKETETVLNYSKFNIGESVNIQQITFVNDSLGFLCGGLKERSGCIYKTKDKGVSWQKIWSATGNCLYGISFINDSLGFACGENLLLLKTTDGGLTWIDQKSIQGQPPASFNSTLRNIFCVDAKTIYVAGGNGYEIGLTYKTYDGGGFWIYNTFENELRSIYFKDRYAGYFAGYGTILATKDSAHSFSSLPVDNDFFVSIFFPLNSLGYACGYNGGIYKTTDGGGSWLRQLKNNNDIDHTRHFNHIKFIDANEGYAAGNNGLIMHTNDGGENWETIKKITEDHLYSIAVINKHRVFITSSGGNIYQLNP
jgi:photosystem II stability/assembly factor-like uncharacterized protein